MARVLVLRGAEDARRTAALLAAGGHEARLLPLQEARPLDPPLGSGPVGGFLATSAQAAPWLARHAAGTGRPVLTVGERTAQALRAAGVADVVAGPGRAADLAVLAASFGRSAPWIYAAGRVRLPDLEAGLEASGVPVRTVEVYDMADRTPSEAELDRLAAGGPLDAVLLLSRVQAELFGALTIRRPAVFPPGLRHLCLSEGIARRLSPDRRAEWSPYPTLDALLALLD